MLSYACSTYFFKITLTSLCWGRKSITLRYCCASNLLISATLMLHCTVAHLNYASAELARWSAAHTVQANTPCIARRVTCNEAQTIMQCVSRAYDKGENNRRTSLLRWKRSSFQLAWCTRVYSALELTMKNALHYSLNQNTIVTLQLLSTKL